ncbi:MAG TPA: FtsX-like permease family protein, partial [Sedimentisphaerales bacterium]|nr:FtsX-like permease family protein [Sedimentisphaerales bacterium]
RTITAAIFAADEKFLGSLNALGFMIDRAELEKIRNEAGLNEDIRKISDLLKNIEFKNRFAGMHNMVARDVTLEDFFRQAGSERDAQEFLDAAASVAGDRHMEALEVSASRMVEIARYHYEQTKIAALEAKIAVTRGGRSILGFSGRTLWLIAVSLMVCVVGIANAMLMSVTERFKEIATMKCLGATDGFIMLNFILESAMQGFTGGVLGALAGVLLGMVRSGTNYGFIAMANLPFAAMLGTAVTAAVVGVVISILAAVYPAWVAARLAPLEAMRVE